METVERRFDAATIAAYYDQCEIDYRLVWDLDRSRALHLGYHDESSRTFADSLRRMNEVVAESAAVQADDHVLDAGCGVGGSSLHLVERIGCTATGITLSSRQADRGRRAAHAAGVAQRARFLVADYQRMPFGAASFSVVWSLESACYAEDKSRFLSEAFRVLRPGGRLIVADGFATRDHCRPEEQEVIDRCLLNWAVAGIDSVGRFRERLVETGFNAIRYTDITAAVLPSIRRMSRIAGFLYPFAGIAGKLGLRTSVQTRNVEGARNAYEVSRRGLSCYGIFVAERPL